MPFDRGRLQAHNAFFAFSFVILTRKRAGETRNSVCDPASTLCLPPPPTPTPSLSLSLSLRSGNKRICQTVKAHKNPLWYTGTCLLFLGLRISLSDRVCQCLSVMLSVRLHACLSASLAVSVHKTQNRAYTQSLLWFS